MRVLTLVLLVSLLACDDSSESEGQTSASSSTGGNTAAASGDGPTWSDDRDPTEAPVDVGAVPGYADRTASGLASHVLRPGTGDAHPSATDQVTVNYSGWKTDGEMFDSSWERGQPATFPLNGVISGWTEGVQLMKVGEIRRFWIPAGMAYGENPGGGRPGGMLVFDIELISIGG